MPKNFHAFSAIFRHCRIYVAGKYMVVADTLSRDVMGDGIYSKVEAKLAREFNDYSVQAIDSLPVSEPK